jgi:hypothetical protein
MSAVRIFMARHGKRLLVAIFGTAVAGGSVAYARRKLQETVPLIDLPVDTGPIVTTPTMGQRLRNIIPKHRPKKANGGGNGGSSTAKSIPTAAPRSTARAEPAERRTPIPERSQQSKNIAEEAQRARDNARESARRNLDGPDFGPTFGRNPRH